MYGFARKSMTHSKVPRVGHRSLANQKRRVKGNYSLPRWMLIKPPLSLALLRCSSPLSAYKETVESISFTFLFFLSLSLTHSLTLSTLTNKGYSSHLLASCNNIKRNCPPPNSLSHHHILLKAGWPLPAWYPSRSARQRVSPALPNPCSQGAWQLSSRPSATRR